jgi:hypothetical protein
VYSLLQISSFSSPFVAAFQTSTSDASSSFLLTFSQPVTLAPAPAKQETATLRSCTCQVFAFFFFFFFFFQFLFQSYCGAGDQHATNAIASFVSCLFLLEVFATN